MFTTNSEFSIPLHGFSIKIRKPPIKSAIKTLFVSEKKLEPLTWSTRGKDTAGASLGRIQIWEVMSAEALVGEP